MSKKFNFNKKKQFLPFHFKKLPNLVWYCCLFFFILGLVLSIFFLNRADKFRYQFHSMLSDLILKNQQGASVFCLHIDEYNYQLFRWNPLFINKLHMLNQPLPEGKNYKIKVISILELKQTQRLFFRIRAGDGISIYINHQLFFDEWHPSSSGVFANFTEIFSSGLILLEIDCYLGLYNELLDIRIVDETGTNVLMYPIKLEVDHLLWQKLSFYQTKAYHHFILYLILALLSLWLPAIWLLIRNLATFKQKLMSLIYYVFPGCLLGFSLVTLWQIVLYWGASGKSNLGKISCLLLLGCLAGSILNVFFRLWLDYYEDFFLVKYYKKVKKLYLKYELWIAPLFYFVVLLFFMSWSLIERGGLFPYSWLYAPWDVLQYKDIMLRGYIINFIKTGGISGNYAWYPLLSWLAYGFYFFGCGSSWALLITVWVTSAIAMTLLFRLANNLFGISSARWSLASLVCYPGSFYLLIGYPYGLAIALGISYFLAIYARNYWLAFFLGTLLGLAYPTAILSCIFPLLIIISYSYVIKYPRLYCYAISISTLGPILGLLGICLRHWLSLNNFFLSITAHCNWNRHLRWPWETIIEGILNESPQYSESIIIILILGLLLVFAYRFNAALWGYLILIFIISPATGTLESIYRQYLMGWPLFLLIGSTPRSRWLKLIFLLVMVFFAFSWYLPLWLNYELV